MMFGPVVSAGDAGALRAGASAVDITPREFPVNMPGGFKTNMAESAHDPLHARALVLDDGATTLAMVVVDSLGVAREVTDEAKTIASNRCGIAVDKILISATHTHSAPSSKAATYRKILTDGIAEAIVRAHGALRPAAVGAAAYPMPEEVFNRRWFLKPGKMPLNPFGKMDQVKMNPGTSPDVIDRPAGPTDPDITIISVQDARRKPLALYANYSLHYVGHVPRARVSADYYGEFARLMPFRVGAGEDFVAMMSNGTSGDINNIPFLVTTGSADKITEQGWNYVFRISPPVSEYPKALNSFLKEVVHPKTVAILYENTLFGQSGSKEFGAQCEKEGISVMLKEIGRASCRERV